MTERPELPLYRCHKTVQAALICSTLPAPDKRVRLLVSTGEDGITDDEVVVSLSWFEKHDPQPGGYFVRYADGYESYSPPEAFEGGYTKLGGGDRPESECLLVAVIELLRGVSKGPSACRENSLALTKCEEALHWLESRKV